MRKWEGRTESGRGLLRKGVGFIRKWAELFGRIEVVVGRGGARSERGVAWGKGGRGFVLYPPPLSPPGLSGGEVAGIILGVLVGLGLISAGGLLAWKLLHR